MSQGDQEKIVLTTTEKRRILEPLRRAVQAQIDRWEAEGEIEGLLLSFGGHGEYDNMQEGIEHLAVACNSKEDLTLRDVEQYVSLLEEE
jgi:hypothetical protein